MIINFLIIIQEKMMEHSPYEKLMYEKKKAQRAEFAYKPPTLFYNGYFIAFMFIIFYPAAIVMLICRDIEVKRQKKEFDVWKDHIVSTRPDIKALVREDKRVNDYVRRINDSIINSGCNVIDMYHTYHTYSGDEYIAANFDLYAFDGKGQELSGVIIAGFTMSDWDSDEYLTEFFKGIYDELCRLYPQKFVMRSSVIMTAELCRLLESRGDSNKWYGEYIYKKRMKSTY